MPLYGLAYAKDQSMFYFIHRFDRVGRTGKRHVEDFAQVGKSRGRFTFTADEVKKEFELSENAFKADTKFS